MRYDSYDLILNHLTAGEHFYSANSSEAFKEYEQMAFLFLNRKGKYLTEEDILGMYREGRTLEEIFSIHENRFRMGATVQKEDKRVRTWYDIMEMEPIEVQDSFFDYFFAIKLRHIDLLEIDDYLAYHLETSFENDKQKYHRFLNLTMRKYDPKMIPSHITETVREWIVITEKTNTVSETAKAEDIKGRIQREAGDKLTTLNLAQTALLIQFMQESKIILKGDDLTYIQAGKAFNILTGFSSHSLRQQLGTKGDLIGVKHEDYKDLHTIILQLADLIGTKVRKK